MYFSQILDFLVPFDLPIDFFPTAKREWMRLIYLSTFVYISIYAFYFAFSMFINVIFLKCYEISQNMQKSCCKNFKNIDEKSEIEEFCQMFLISKKNSRTRNP